MIRMMPTMYEQPDFINNYLKFEKRLKNLYWKRNPNWYMEFKKFDDEKFEEVDGYYGFYFISNYGQVISFYWKFPRLKRYQFTNGFFSVSLNLSGSSHFYIHDLVYKTFVGPIRSGHRVIHKNRIITDNYYKNLKMVKLSSSTKMIREKLFDFDLYHRVEAEAPPCNNVTVAVLQYDWEGKYIREYPSIKTASVSTGISCDSLIECMKGENQTAGGFQWRYKRDMNVKAGIYDIGPVKYSPDIRLRAVVQFDLDGNFIMEYSTIAQAVEFLDVDSPGISQCASGIHKTAGGFQWRYRDDPLFKNGIVNIGPAPEYVTPNRKAVLQFDLEGKFIKEYPSISEASRELGIKEGNLSTCLKGKIKSCGGFQWKYKDDPRFDNGVKAIDPAAYPDYHKIEPVLQFDMEGKFVKKFDSAAQAAGEFNVSVFSLYSCLQGKVNTCAGFQWRYQRDLGDNQGDAPSIEPNKKKIMKRYTSIFQFSLQGKFIREYASVRDASKKLGINNRCITSCLSGAVKTGGGFQWRSGDNPMFKEGIIHLEPIRYPHTIAYQPILQFDKDGNLVKEYDTAREAAKEVGISLQSIRLCLKGETYSAGGFQWEKKEEISSILLNKGEYKISPLKKKIKDTKVRREILQFDLEGKFIKKHQSITRAARLMGKSLSPIRKSLKDSKSTAYDFQWRYSDDPHFKKGIVDIEPAGKKRNPNPIPVLQFHVSGKFIREYPSVSRAAKKLGISRKVISYCAEKKTPIGGGFQWRYRSDPIFKKGICDLSAVRMEVNVKPVLQFDLMGNFMAEYTSPAEASTAAGISRSALNESLRGKTRISGKYQWRWKSDPIFSNGVVNIGPVEKIDQYNHTPILQFDRDGKFIRQYPNIKEAAKALGINIALIRGSFKGAAKTAAGYQWKTIHDPLFKNGITNIAPLKVSVNPTTRSVVQLDLENKPIREFPSIRQAAKEMGMHPLSIATCAKGKVKTAGGFIWKFK